MQTITAKELSTIAEKSGELCVSLSVPVDPLTSDPKVNSIAFKNAATQALQQLENDHKRSETYQTLLKVSKKLQENPLFWKEQSKGFILYVVGSWSKSMSLPVEVLELQLVADHLYIISLIATQITQNDFYVLELDKEQTCMWWGNSQEIKQITVPDLPESIEEVTGTEVNERNLQFHTGTTGSNGSARPAAYHGSSSWKDDKDRYLERFLHAVNQSVTNFLEPGSPPVLISGTEELVVLFKRISTIKNLGNQDLHKVVDSPHKVKNLHELAMQVMEKTVEREKKAIATAFQETVPEYKTTDLTTVLIQAYQGKIDTLILQENTQVWGSFDPTTLTVNINTDSGKTSYDLLNLAAVLTVRSSGKVLLLPKTDMPELAKAAAVLRY
jgi:hypothetical protein